MRHGILAQFDFGAIADAPAHPYRLQCEQSRLTRILYEQLRGQAGFELTFNSCVIRRIFFKSLFKFVGCRFRIHRWRQTKRELVDLSVHLFNTKEYVA
jgi:hypothetical protein